MAAQHIHKYNQKYNTTMQYNPFNSKMLNFCRNLLPTSYVHINFCASNSDVCQLIKVTYLAFSSKIGNAHARYVTV